MIQIYKVEVSLNGRDHIAETLDVDYNINKDNLRLVKRVLANSFGLEYEDEVYIYLHYKNLKK